MWDNRFVQVCYIFHWQVSQKRISLCITKMFQVISIWEERKWQTLFKGFKNISWMSFTVNRAEVKLKGLEGVDRFDISPVPRYPLNRSPIRSTNAPQMSIPNNATYKQRQRLYCVIHNNYTINGVISQQFPGHFMSTSWMHLTSFTSLHTKHSGSSDSDGLRIKLGPHCRGFKYDLGNPFDEQSSIKLSPDFCRLQTVYER